ncbi:MAG: hypothetical protein SO253_03740 [Bacilli bacterium]|nr:hypothetical protein [Bacilli bacterium]
MINKIKENILKEVKKYFAFADIIEIAFKNCSTKDTYFYKSAYVCFNGFVHSLKSYLLSVYDDIDQEEYTMMPKANANRILLRNCLESNLILNIIQNNPLLAEKYYATLKSDVDRIDETYTEIDQTSIDLKKYMKRFSWLPRVKGKKCSALKDILHFVDFGDNKNYEYYYSTLIKNFDTFVHPSFKFAESIKDKKVGEEISNIAALFISNGIVYDCCYNILSNLASVYENLIDKECYSLLDDILKNKINDFKEHDIRQTYLKNKEQISEYVHSLPYSIISLASSINNASYKSLSITYLLYDLSSHYDDMLMSYYIFDVMMFYAQARYVIESLSLINCLLNDDDERSEIYYLHQNIKSYDAKITAINFLIQYNMRGKEDPVDVNNVHIENVEKIRSYYRKNFNVIVDDNKILRLNGWALYLKNINNENVPNSPFFVDLLGNNLLNNKEITHYLLGFYEESNAFTHITPYAFDPTQINFDLVKPLLLINELTQRLSYNIIKYYDLKNKLSHDEYMQIELGLTYAISKLKNDLTRQEIK